MLILGVKFRFGFKVDWILWDTIHWAHSLALWLIKMAHAFCAVRRVDLVNLLALIDGFVWAHWLTNIAINAFVGNDQRHNSSRRLRLKPRKIDHSTQSRLRREQSWRHCRPLMQFPVPTSKKEMIGVRMGLEKWFQILGT